MISVVLPTFNRGSVLARAIGSVLNQTYADLELLVIDDASTDDTRDVVQSIHDERLRYLRLANNVGPAAARNAGIRQARGDLIAFQDSDDEWLPGKLEEQMKVFENAPAEVGVVYTGFWKVQGDKKTYIPSSTTPRMEGNIHDILLRGNFVGTPTAVVKKECFGKAGMFDEEMAMLEDWELWIRISAYYQFRFINKPLVVSHHTPGGVNEQSADIWARAIELILEKHFQDFRSNTRLLARHQYSIGNLLCQSGRVAQGREYLFRTVKAYPLNIKYLVAAFVSLFGESAYAKVVRLKRRIRPVDRSGEEGLQ